MSIFSKKHYKVVASILSQTLQEAEDLRLDIHPATVMRIADHFSDAFKEDNEKFDSVKFYAAIGGW